MVRTLVRDAIDHHDDDPRLLRIMIEEASFSQELVDTLDRHSRTRAAQVRDLLAGHPDVRVENLDVATDLIMFTVELNTHRLMATHATCRSRPSGTNWSPWSPATCAARPVCRGSAIVSAHSRGGVRRAPCPTPGVIDVVGWLRLVTARRRSPRSVRVPSDPSRRRSDHIARRCLC
ncbi:hypothetical protein [Micromonospora matsumotoense]|uniref:hypothetical protein n=1 Tax=Micromonospora matsumotoense TaxID=121616 RepID=UPI001C407B0A|nr:hypothetical protein [Micromonospora matsumotoense]